MRRHVLALIGAVALAAPMLATGTAQAAAPRVAPDAPEVQRVYPGPNSGQITIDWDPVAGATKYQVHIQEADPLTEPLITGPITTPTSYTWSGLDSRKTYIVGVRSGNATDEFSDWNDSDPIRPFALNAPASITAVPRDGGVLVEWEAVSPTPSQGYEVQFRDVNFLWPDDTANTISVGKNVTSVLITQDLSANFSYLFRVRATNGGTQVSEWRATTQGVSPTTTPAPPEDVHAVPGNGNVALSWREPNPGPASYEIQQSTDGRNWVSATPGSVVAPATSVTINGLTNGTGYYFQMRSVRSGAQSAWVSATPAPVVPTPSYVTPANPTNVSAVPGNSIAIMYWQIPSGTVVTSYDVQYSTDGNNWLPSTPIGTRSTATNYTLGGLTNGVAYYLRVRAVNGTAVSQYANLPGVVVPVALPGPPTGVYAVPGNAQATVSWVAPAAAAGQIRGYRVQSSTNNGATWVNVAELATTATSTLIGNLSNGTAYVFRVQALGPTGDGPWSTPSAAIIPPGPPGPPTGLVATAGNGQATVRWTAPAGTPVSPIIGYKATAFPGGQSCQTSATPPATPATTCTITGLTNGQSYTITAVTVSYSGTSAQSAPSNVVTPQGGPNPPTGVTAVAGDRSATVTWTPPASSAGAPITSYRATSSPDGRTCTASAPATSCTVTGLTNGQPYTFTVVAISATGTSASSAASAPVTPFTTEVTIRITDSSRDGKKVIIKGTTQGVDPGDTLNVLIRNSGKGNFNPAGEVVVKSNGTFRWTTNNVSKTWLRVTDGDVVSNTVIVPAR